MTPKERPLRWYVRGLGERELRDLTDAQVLAAIDEMEGGRRFGPYVHRADKNGRAPSARLLALAEQFNAEQERRRRAWLATMRNEAARRGLAGS